MVRSKVPRGERNENSSSNLISHATRRIAHSWSASFVPFCFLPSPYHAESEARKRETERERKRVEEVWNGKNNCLPIEGAKSATTEGLQKKRSPREKEETTSGIHEPDTGSRESLFSFTPQITARLFAQTTDHDRRRLIAVLIYEPRLNLENRGWQCSTKGVDRCV